MRSIGIAVVTAVGLATSGAQANDPTRGQEVFNSKCASCHSLEHGRHRSGPSLHGLWGEQIGAAEGFRYSKSFQQKSASGAIWDEESIDAFVERPRRFIKKNRMAFRGVRDEQERADLLAFLKTQQK